LIQVNSAGSLVTAADVASWDYFAATMVAITPDTLYTGFSNINSASGSQLLALDKSDPAITRWTFQAEGMLNQQIAVDRNQNVFFSTQDGTLYSVNSAGVQNWKISSGEPSSISPVLGHHELIWGSGNRIFHVTVE